MHGQHAHFGAAQAARIVARSRRERDREGALWGLREARRDLRSPNRSDSTGASRRISRRNIACRWRRCRNRCRLSILPPYLTWSVASLYGLLHSLSWRNVQRLGDMRNPDRSETAEMQLFRGLEEQLLQPEVRTSRESLAALLADEFIEIGSSGRVYSKQQIIDLLRHEGGQGSPPTLRDFSARRLAAEVILVTYRVLASQTIRSSVWKLMGGRWQMVFHQGTRSGVLSERTK
jgi:hypothetical protein